MTRAFKLHTKSTFSSPSTLYVSNISILLLKKLPTGYFPEKKQGRVGGGGEVGDEIVS